jgi:hypothetical protein
MKIGIISDLHVEFGNSILTTEEDLDVLVFNRDVEIKVVEV